jgi:archaellin
MHKLFKFDRKGAAGITSTLILTSLLLVSGAAASTIIETNNEYQQQAEETSQEAISEVATGIDVVDAIGHYENRGIVSIDLLVRLSCGSPIINLDFLTIILSSTTSIITYTLNSSDANDRFYPEQINVASGLPTWDEGSSCLIGDGDIVQISLSGFNILPGQSVNIKLIPAHGHENFVTLTVPDTIVGTVVTLR